MTVLVWKEGRLLLRGFLVLLALIVGAFWIPLRQEGLLIIAGYIICPAAALMLALESFGREFSSKTFSGLLALPVSRERVWWTKNGLLALALLVAWFLWWQVVQWKAASDPDFHRYRWLMQWGSLVYLWVVFSGGLWSTLLCRQVVAASWTAILVPFALALVLTNWSWDLSARVWMAVFTLYGFAGWILAWWLYRRAEDTSILVSETGEGIWEGWSRRLRFFPVLRAGHSSSVVALIQKEVQLHHSYLVVGLVLLGMHLVVLGIRTWTSGWRDSQVGSFCLENYWMLWVVLPWMVGCGAVAEERRLGMWEGQMCSPMGRRGQLWIKYGVALALGWVGGGVMPLLLDGKHVMETVASGPEMNVQQGLVYQLMQRLPQYQVVHELLGMALPFSMDVGGMLAWGAMILMLSLVSLWSSSLFRSTLQALGPALLMLVLCFVGYFHFRYPVEFHGLIGWENLWRSPLGLVIAVPLFLGLGIWLLYRNGLELDPNWNVWRRNFLALFGALVATYMLSIGLYHRVWERWTPMESSPGAARLNVVKSPGGDYRPRFIRSTGIGLTVALADGRIWSARSVSERAPGLSGMWMSSQTYHTGEQGVVSVQDWVSVASGSFDLAVVKKDGSLWVSAKPATLGRIQSVNGQFVPTVRNDSALVRYGDQNDWKSVVSLVNSVILLKTDGTLWRLGQESWGGRNWPGLRNMELTRLGEDQDWESMDAIWSYAALLRKKDGRVYAINWGAGVEAQDLIRLESGMVVYRVSYLDDERDRVYAQAAARSGMGLDFLLALDRGGRLWVKASYGMANRGAARRFFMEQKNVELGSETDWVGLAGNAGRAVTLKSDGTLWLWDFPVDPGVDSDAARVDRLGTRSDWVAVSAGFGGVVSLAADGTFWLWRFNPMGRWGGYDWFPLLGESSKPVKVAEME